MTKHLTVRPAPIEPYVSAPILSLSEEAES